MISGVHNAARHLSPGGRFVVRLAGLALEQRVANWDGTPFRSGSESHVSIWRKPLDASNED